MCPVFWEMYLESEEELKAQLQRFGRTLAEKKQFKIASSNRKGDEEDALRTLEKEFSNLVQQRGRLDAEWTVCASIFTLVDVSLWIHSAHPLAYVS